jgi:hypothetical protein
VAQIRLIFKLPDEFGPHPSPLVYVHWFKPLRAPVPNLNFYSTSFSSLNHRQRASIISVSDIIRTCHLIPQFGNSSAADLGWTAAKVHQEAKSFYLNPYLRHYDFYFMRFLLDDFLISQQEMEREREERRARAIAIVRPRRGRH